MGSLIVPDEPIAKKESKKRRSNRKRAQHRDSARSLLESRGIGYHTNNDGIHLIVQGNSGYIDFWPGTGKWRARAPRIHGFGILNLIEMIESGQL